MDLLKILDVISKAAQVAPTAGKLIGLAIVGLQHSMPGSTGEQKKQAAIEIAAPILAGIDMASPAAGDKIAAVAGQAEETVQNLFDLIKQTNPQVLKVHPDNQQLAVNRADLANRASSVPQGGNQVADQNQKQTGSSTGSGAASISDELAQARAKVAELEQKQQQEQQQNNAGTAKTSTGAPD